MSDIFILFKKFKHYFSRLNVLIVLGLVMLFFATRLLNLLDLPIFTDEAIYIHWAKLAWKDASWRFVSLTDGRQPLQTWATIPFLKIFPNPLLAGRLFGVASGFFATTGIYLLLSHLFNKKWAAIGTFLYILNPYYLFYDRMALVDSLVNGFFIWSVYLSLLLIKYPRLDLALIFGMLAGLGSLAKSTIRIFFIPQLLAPFIFYFYKKNFVKKIINYFVLFSFVAFLALIFYNLQRLSPFMHYIEQKNTTFLLTIPEFINSPFNPLIHNLKTVPYYFLSESGYFMVLAGLIGLVLMFKKKPRLVLYLLLFFLAPFGAISAFAKVVFPRYLIFLTIPFFIGFVYLLQKNKFKVWIGLVYLLSVTYLNYTVLFAWPKMPLPEIDRGQYIEGASAGYGTLQIVEFLKQEVVKHQKVYVFTEGTFGLLPYSLGIYFPYIDSPISLEARWPLKDEDFVYGKDLSNNYPVYYVFHERKDFPPDWPLRLIRKYPRPGGKTNVYLFAYQEK